MLTDTQASIRWLWPCYNPPGLLVGPLPYVKGPNGWYAPDYSYPGVAQRVRVEVDFIIDQERYRD